MPRPAIPHVFDLVFQCMRDGHSTLLPSNMPPSAEKYEPLLNEGSDHQPDDGRHSAEYGLRLPLSSRRRERTVKLLVALDAVLAALLLVLVVVLWREKAMVPAPPYSPAWEAVRYVNKRFEKDDRFYADNETDAAVDEIWLNLTGREFISLHVLLLWEKMGDR